ncbi:MAG: sigma-54 dependent transcriptional regulator [Thermoanaerobaculia bacterium]|nr:sigma-54 dependent transcriptional regulator [Thermoanaerobaculia bacterium]
MTRILIVDDERATSAGMADVVEEWGYEADVADDVKSAWKSIQKLVPDIALVDLRLPDGTGLDLLKRIKDDYPDVPVIILTGHASVDSAVDALKEGAEDYLTKPVDLSRLEIMLRNLEDKKELRQEVLELRRQLQKMGALGHLVGKSPAMKKLYQEIEMVANTDANVFIVGESGSGKEVVSNTIHSLSARKNKPFIAFNCGAISPTLIESEIFGHEKGAFTNAVKRREGYFELAKGGTVFLDEITEMPLDLQVKLLRVLEEGKFRRVGGNQEIEIDARIIAASNRDPLDAIEEGKLREDLYYRLNVFPIEVPPLRERKEDIPLFAFHFLEMMNEEEGKEVDKMSPQFQEALERYDWPGNVRELRNIVNRAFIMARGDTLTIDSLPDKFLQGARRRKTSLTLPIGKPLDEVDRLVAQETLVWAEGDRERAAESLGLSKKQYEKLLTSDGDGSADKESPKKKKGKAESSKSSASRSSKKSKSKKSSSKKTAKKSSGSRKSKSKKSSRTKKKSAKN